MAEKTIKQFIIYDCQEDAFIAADEQDRIYFSPNPALAVLFDKRSEIIDFIIDYELEITDDIKILEAHTTINVKPIFKRDLSPTISKEVDKHNNPEPSDFLNIPVGPINPVNPVNPFGPVYNPPIIKYNTSDSTSDITRDNTNANIANWIESCTDKDPITPPWELYFEDETISSSQGGELTFADNGILSDEN